MNKLGSIISSMNYRELRALQKDLYEGNLGKQLKYNLQRFEARFPEKTCPTCGNLLTDELAKFTLMFGPADFKKKASFCGTDCLSFFVKKLSDDESKLIQHQE